MEIGQKIKKIRELRNYSQEYMAMHLGISQEAYCRIETGQTKIELNRLKKIAETLEVEPYFLMNFDDSYVFNSCTQSGKIINQYNGISERDYTAILKRLDGLEKEVKSILSKVRKDS